MSGSLNKVLLIGRLGNDPEIKQMVNGKSVARLSLATSNTWKDKNPDSLQQVDTVIKKGKIVKENQIPLI